MKNVSLGNKPRYFNLLDLVAMIIALTIANVIGIIVPIFAIMPFSEVDIIESLTSGEIVKNTLFVLLSYLISFSLLLFFLVKYRKCRVSREVNTPPLTPIFGKKIKSPINIIYGIIFISAINIVIEPIIMLFPEEIAKLELLTLNIDIFTVITVTILAPLLEEMIFRGVIFNDINRHLSTFTAILISSFIFGAIHLNIVQLIGGSLGAVAICYVYLTTGSLWGAIVIHFFQNSASLISNHFFGDYDTLQQLINNQPFYYLIYGVSMVIVVWFFRETINFSKERDSHAKLTIKNNID
ncbi:MAG: CPBP family intramembrane glutamic endopeptidase [Rikenellaceae bacterium]